MQIKECPAFETVREHIEAVNPALNAVVTFIDEQSNENEGPLKGVSVALKDNINTKGVTTTASSKILENYVPVYDATIVKKLKEAGAVFPVKASMDELGMGGTNKNALTGPVHNAWDLSRISGGSSGGCAVLTAAGCVPLAIGSDTGDSVRKPAAYNGVVGVKPTYGRISRYGIIPYASSLDHVAYFTTGIEDAALALEVLAGRDEHDMTTSLEPVGAYLEDLSPDLKGRTLGVFKNVQDGVESEAMQKAWAELEDKLKAAGVTLKTVAMPQEYVELIPPVYKTIANAEATANHSNLDGLRFGRRVDGESVEDVMTRSRTEGFSSYVRERFVIGSYSLFEENQDRLFRKAQKIRRLIVDAYAKMFDGVDAIICFAAPTVAPLMEESADAKMGESNAVEEHLQLGNFSGYPSLTMPLGLENGLPFGLEVAARPFEEQTMFDVAAGIEELTGLKGQTTEVQR